jgi:hypothetical protein
VTRGVPTAHCAATGPAQCRLRVHRRQARPSTMLEGPHLDRHPPPAERNGSCRALAARGTSGSRLIIEGRRTGN